MKKNEAGVALLLVVFIIAVGTLLVFEMGRTSRYDSRSARAFAERVQGNYVIRSGFNLSQVLLAIPKLDRPPEDWPGDLWAQLGQARELPIQGLPGTPRIEIIDENSKLNLNWLGGSGRQADGWRLKFASLFNQLGFVQESFPAAEARTIGNIAYSDQQEVAVISDWIDPDDESLPAGALGAAGIESASPPAWFYNRELRNLSESLLIPGITRERLSLLAPFVRATDTQGESTKVNVNTARFETLVALGYSQSSASEIVVGRGREPIDSTRLKEINAQNPSEPPLDKITSTKSTEFSVVVRVRMPNSVRWGRASIAVSGGGANEPRSTSLQSLELY
jgi:type II secretory pathway component PulK